VQTNSEIKVIQSVEAAGGPAANAQRALDEARAQLEAVASERTQIIAKKEAAQGRLKSVALASFRRDATALKTQKTARAELEDVEFAQSDIDIALGAAQELVAQCEMRLLEAQLQEYWQATIALGNRRAETLQRREQLIEQLNAEAAEYEKDGQEIRLILQKSLRLRPTGGARRDESPHAVDRAIGHVGSDVSRMAAMLAGGISWEQFRVWPKDRTPHDVQLAEKERLYWQRFQWEIAHGGLPRGMSNVR
jgi:hypothetical protein